MSPTFDEFLAGAKTLLRSNASSHIKHPGFHHLYVRYGQRYINGETVHSVFTIATVEASVRGEGTFKKFVSFLREEHPELALYVENAHPQFGEGLLRMGFTRVEDDSMHEIQSNYFMPTRNGGISL